MLHKWKTTGALLKHFNFQIRGGSRGEPAKLLDRLYADTPDFKHYGPVMAAATYLIAYGIRFQDASLGNRLDRALPRLLAQGHLTSYQVELLLAYGDDLSSQFSGQVEVGR